MAGIVIVSPDGANELCPGSDGHLAASTGYHGDRAAPQSLTAAALLFTVPLNTEATIIAQNIY